jgi:hypothetical protein
MTQPAETFDAYDAVGNREDLSDIIYNISPTETPFMMMCGRGRASAISHEWQTDSLAAAATNALVSGDDAAGDAIAATVRLNNRTQISGKVVIVSGTQEAVDSAGRKSELSYQLAKKAKELKRDMELIATGNYALTVGNATTARTLASLEVWYETNGSYGSGGSNSAKTAGQPDAAATATDGTQRAFTETLLKTVIQQCWTQGGNPTVIMVGPVNKQTISGFTGGSTRFDKSEDKRLVTAIDVYVSDFGEHRVVPNRFSRDRTAHVLTPKLWSFDYLRSFRQHALAKTGDAEKRQLLVEWTLRASNEAGSGPVADLTT